MRYSAKVPGNFGRISSMSGLNGRLSQVSGQICSSFLSKYRGDLYPQLGSKPVVQTTVKVKLGFDKTFFSFNSQHTHTHTHVPARKMFGSNLRPARRSANLNWHETFPDVAKKTCNDGSEQPLSCVISPPPKLPHVKLHP